VKSLRNKPGIMITPETKTMSAMLFFEESIRSEYQEEQMLMWCSF
jgi:hypothetical protein